MAATKSNGKKNKAHEPNDKTRAEVSALVSFGNTQEEIAAHLDISADTLAKYYREELDSSVVRANAKVAAKLFRKAIDGDVTCMLFWLKTRGQGKWREKDEKEVRKSAQSIIELLVDKLVD